MAPALAVDSVSSASAAVPFRKHMEPSPADIDTFHQLVADLSRILGPSSGLTTEGVDVELLEKLMREYDSKESQWAKYAFADLSRGYTRNLVDEGNGKSNLLVLVWTPGKGSPIHDHADAHCLMKILKGTLRESRFSYPAAADGQSPPTLIKDTIYRHNEVTYMSDELGLHRISNPDPNEIAVSLHLYTPPNAAREGCHIFDEKTGRRSHVSQSNFYSVFGKRTKDA